jgi:hypothetical protein
MIQVTASQVSQGYDPQQLIDHLNDTQRGGFLYIHGYCSEGTGEVANHWVQGACIYPNMVNRSVALIDNEELMAKIEAEGLEVHRGGWFNSEGKGNPACRKSKEFHTFQAVDRTYSMENEEDLAKIMLAIASLREGLVNPKKVDQGYSVEAKGAYSKEDQPAGVLYLRDSMTVHKHVTFQGEYKPKASSESTAIKEALRKMLPVGRYRAYKLCGNFEYITVGGLSIIQGANIGQWELALALPESIKQVTVQETAKVLVQEITADLED